MTLNSVEHLPVIEECAAMVLWVNACLFGEQDQYSNISEHTLKGIEFCEKFAHFVRERCAIENEYARGLRYGVRNS